MRRTLLFQAMICEEALELEEDDEDDEEYDDEDEEIDEFEEEDVLSLR